MLSWVKRCWSRAWVAGLSLSLCAGQVVSLFTGDLNPEFDSQHIPRDACWWVVPGTPKHIDIVTNPPFNEANRIVPAFVRAGHRCAFLLRLSWLEPTGDRQDFLAENPPSGLIVLPRYSFTGDGKTDSATAAWMLWGFKIEPAIQVAKKANR